MTLAQWCKVAGVLPTHPTTERGAVSLIADAPAQSELYHDLYNLSDYRVDNLVGGIVWLIPRKPFSMRECPTCHGEGEI